MANLLFGISASAVEALVSKVNDAIKEESKQWQILQRDFVFVRDEFETIQSFLGTDIVKGTKNNLMKIWIRQVRNLSYDAEDCLENILHLDTKRSYWPRLRQAFGDPAMLRPLPLDEMVAEIKLLKARVEDLSQRKLRYRFSDESNVQMQQISAASTSAMDVLIKTKEALENQNGVVDLACLITIKDESLQVISIFGTGGGLGKLSVIKKMYDSQEIRKGFTCYAWVKLMNPFNLHDFIKRLEAQFALQQGIGANVLPAMMKATEDVLAKEFVRRINENRYLIVLEDLSSIEDWNTILSCLPDMRNGSRIIVSTQQIEMASLCTGQPNQVFLISQFSSPDYSVYAFSKKNIPHQVTQHENNSKSSDWLKEQKEYLRSSDERVLGRESELRKFDAQIKLARSGQAHNVVSVCGIAGVGKTYLVRFLYSQHCSSQDGTFYKCAWVNAPHPFKILDFCQSLCSQLTPEKVKLTEEKVESTEENVESIEDKSLLTAESTEDKDVAVRCWKLLDEHPYLVVIDELQSKEDWDLIKAHVISRTSKSCIVVISREESVARHCATTEDAVCSVSGLEADAALHLFEKVTAGAVSGACNRDSLKVEAGHIISKFGQLPKLVVALGSYLGNGRNAMQEIRRLNASFICELKTTKELDDFQKVFSWMYSTFQASPHVVKKCIFYLSLFTQGSIIRRRRLVMRWIAEGYCEGNDSIGMVEYAEELVRKLVTLGIVRHDRQKFLVLNSLFLDYIISREMKETVFPPLELLVLQGGNSQSTHQVGQHLAIGSSWNRDKFVFDNMDFSRLRSLTVCREWNPFFISHRMRVVRVLDLEDTNVTNDDVRQIVDHLRRLKFLSLRRCTRVSLLPASLGELNQLQTLDIRHTNVILLPGSVSKLRNLQYFRAGCSVELTDHQEPLTRSRYEHVDAFDGVKMPRHIEQLMALHTLGVMNVNNISGKSIQHRFKNLTKLRKLGISGINRRNIKGFLSATVGHGHLESLSLQLHMDRDLHWLGQITTPRDLQRLKMCVHVHCFHHWTCLQVLGQIRRLHTLRLRFEVDGDVVLQFCDWQDGTAWPTRPQFCDLKVLEIACRTNLHVKFAQGEMKQLELLNIRCLGRSSLNFSGLEHASSLKRVWIMGCFDDSVKDELRQKVLQHPNRPIMKLDGPSSP